MGDFNWRQFARDGLVALAIMAGVVVVYGGLLLALGRPLW